MLRRAIPGATDSRPVTDLAYLGLVNKTYRSDSFDVGFILPRRRGSSGVLKILLILLALALATFGMGLTTESVGAQEVPPPPTEPSDPPPSEPPPSEPPPAAEPEPQAAPAYPPAPAGSGAGRRVVYSNSQQRVWLVEADESVGGSWLVSGRRGVPRPGTYRVFSKSRHSSALRGRVRMEYMTRFARGRRLAIGFHSIPVDRRGRPIQTEAQLGTFRSAGCVRQSLQDAARLWEWAPIGTTVVVVR